jgi:hypothetical protein
MSAMSFLNWLPQPMTDEKIQETVSALAAPVRRLFCVAPCAAQTPSTDGADIGTLGGNEQDER